MKKVAIIVIGLICSLFAQEEVSVFPGNNINNNFTNDNCRICEIRTLKKILENSEKKILHISNGENRYSLELTKRDELRIYFRFNDKNLHLLAYNIDNYHYNTKEIINYKQNKNKIKIIKSIDVKIDNFNINFIFSEIGEILRKRRIFLFSYNHFGFFCYFNYI